MLSPRRAALCLVAILGVVGSLAQPGTEPPAAEALSALRAKIVWSMPDTPCIPADKSVNTDASARTCGNTLTRQSNSDSSATQVFTFGTTSDQHYAADGTPCPNAGDLFCDAILFTPSLDIADAVIRVHQTTYASTANGCAVTITDLKQDGISILTDPPDPGTVQLNAGQLLGGTTYELDIESRVPTASQVAVTSRLRTTRVFTSTIRVGDRTPDITTPVPGATPRPTPTTKPCGFRPADRPIRSLNKSLVVRTELQAAQWAQKNGRPTPTPIVIR